MKSLITALILIIGICMNAQDIEGAWRWEGTDEEGNAQTAVAVLMDGFQVATWYKSDPPEFLHTNGGKYRLEGDTVFEVVEFDSKDSSRVGQTVQFKIAFDGDQVTIVDDGTVWKRIDDGTPGDLAGPWLISGRKRNGQISERDTDRPRKTMKLLSGTRFQWIAYNTATKQFLGTGGGNYTTIDGKYAENIDFFSRDNSRVGASLVFDYEIVDGKWHHSGKSSKGDPMYEIWSHRNK